MAVDVYQQTRAHLHTLGLRAIADQLAPALESAERSKPGYTQFLHDLLAAEVAAVEQRRLQGRLRFAKLPARRTLEQFDFAAQPNLDRRLVEDLATLRFIEQKANVLLIGPPGVGKTMWPRSSATRPSRPATASTTPPPPTSSPAPARPRWKAGGRPPCGSGTAHNC